MEFLQAEAASIRQVREFAVEALRALVYLFGAFYYSRYALFPVLQACAEPDRRHRCALLLTRLANWATAWRKRQSSILHDAIKQHMDEFRVTQCRKAIVVWAHILSAVLPLGALAFQVSDFSMPGAVLVRTIFIVGQAVFGLLLHDGHIELTNLKLRICHAVVTIVQLVEVARIADDPRFFTHTTYRLLSRGVFGLAMLDYRQTVPCNIAMSIVTSWRFSANSAALTETTDSSGVDFVVLEMCTCIMMSVGCYVVQTWLEARFRVQIIAQNQKRATLKLADNHCDALFWLTPDLHINGPAARLADMLFVRDAPDNLDGRQFEAYIASDSDRTRFREFIQVSTATQAEGVPAAFHMDLRDATSRTFPVEVFHACFEDSYEQIGHVIGICEYGPHDDRAWHPGTGEAQDAAEAEVEVPPWVLPMVAREQSMPAGEHMSESLADSGTAADDGASICESVFTGQMSADESVGSGQMSAARCIDRHKATSEATPALMPLMPDHGDHDNVSVMFDAVTGEMLGCTIGFTSLLGPLIFKAKIREVVVNQANLLKWIKHAVNEFLNPHDSASDSNGRPVEALDIKLTSPTARTDDKRLEFSAKANMIKVQEYCMASDMCVGFETGRGDQEHEILCVVKFQDILPQWSDQKKENKKKKRSTRKRRNVGDICNTVTL